MENLGEKYNRDWFQKRAIESLVKTGENSWDYTDSLLLYSPQGQDAYEVAHDMESPYVDAVVAHEHAYLRAITKEVVARLPQVFEHIDLGPGVEHKETYFFDAIHDQGKEFTYTPIDVSDHFLSVATKSAEAEGVHANPIQASFEELPKLLKRRDVPRFVTLLGLTYSNYAPSEIIKLLREICGEGGYIFIDAQLHERVDIDALRKIYQQYVAPACDEKLRLLGIDPSKDVTDRIADEHIAITCSLLFVNEALQAKGLKVGDTLKVFQSLRPDRASFERELEGLDYTLFDVGNSFVGVLIKT